MSLLLALTASSPTGYTITCNAGSYALTGQNSAIAVGRLIAANAGSYSLSGQNATISYTPIAGYTITCDSGAYSIAGQNAAISYEAINQKHGGDDAFHKGWDKKAWLKKQKAEELIEATIKKEYRKILGIEPEQAEVKEIAISVEEAPTYDFVDYSGVSEWLQAQEFAIQSLIARMAEEEDEETLLMLL